MIAYAPKGRRRGMYQALGLLGVGMLLGVLAWLGMPSYADLVGA